jgi:AcrR family transcriptional regulator/transposase-like protein
VPEPSGIRRREGPPETHPHDDECLEWLWRRRFAVDGRTAVCPRCDRPTRFYRLRSRRAYACDRCGRQLYPTADTPFSGTSTPLSVWFRAAHELRDQPPDVSGSELARRLDIDYRAALRIRSRLIAAFSQPRTAELLRAAGDWHVGGGGAAAAIGTGTGQPPGPHVDAILRVASKAIAQSGLEAVRVADVARDASLSTAEVRRQFRTKESLLLACFNWTEEQLAARVEELMRAEDDPVRRLRGLVELSLASPGLLRDEYRLWLEVWVRVRERVHELDDTEVFYGAHDALLDTIRQGKASGTFKPVASPEAIAESMIALSDGLAFKVAEGYWEISVTRSRELLHLFCEQALGLQSGALNL